MRRQVPRAVWTPPRPGASHLGQVRTDGRLGRPCSFGRGWDSPSAEPCESDGGFVVAKYLVSPSDLRGPCATAGPVCSPVWARLFCVSPAKAAVAASCSVRPPALPRPRRGRLSAAALERSGAEPTTNFGENVGLLFKGILYLVLYIKPLTDICFQESGLVGAGGPRTGPPVLLMLAPSVDFF